MVKIQHQSLHQPLHGATQPQHRLMQVEFGLPLSFQLKPQAQFHCHRLNYQLELVVISEAQLHHLLM